MTHARCTASIVDYIVKKDLSDFMLVGHSFGGTMICKVAEAIPERIRRLVFWNGFVLKDGNSLNDECPPHYRELFDQLVQDSPDYTVMLPFPLWKDVFINDADPELAKTAYETLSPEPYKPFQEKLDLKRFYSLEIPRSYLNCTEDIALPPGEWGWHPRMSSRLGSSIRRVWRRSSSRPAVIRRGDPTRRAAQEQLNPYYGEIGESNAIEMVVECEQTVATFESMSSD